MGLLEEEIKILLNQMELTQWKPHSVNMSLFGHKVMSREGIRNIKMSKGYYETKTSGSTGEPVIISKS